MGADTTTRIYNNTQKNYGGWGLDWEHTLPQIHRKIRTYKQRYNKFNSRIYRATKNPNREPREADVQAREHNLAQFKYWLTLYHVKNGTYEANRPPRYAPGNQAPTEEGKPQPTTS